MTSLRLTALGATLALTALMGAGAAHAAAPTATPAVTVSTPSASAEVPTFSNGYGLAFADYVPRLEAAFAAAG
ncbi:hypothetical protein [Streptomyces sp. ISL-94]|uniref:hypothetical protein n=1 Tax=Streptomyces sp. ISL-94 TaxID=2819190 RepID=UPI001BED3645|nr:hypothetical protein [Streptomyces sp. ISL-94]MBT2480110.1 hypothetical protein [Streptomyces sp. ISL-94]